MGRVEEPEILYVTANFDLAKSVSNLARLLIDYPPLSLQLIVMRDTVDRAIPSQSSQNRGVEQRLIYLVRTFETRIDLGL